MVILGHAGITTGIIKLYEKATHKPSAPIDYRAVIIGSLLPDLIDKPLGMVFLRNTFHNSRLFAHTLLFSAVLLIIGLILFRRRQSSRLLLLSVCCFIHLALDSMWQYTAILFWPFIGAKIVNVAQLGWVKAFLLSRAFPARPEGQWITQDITFLLHDPFYMGAELFGFAVLAFLFLKAIRRKQLKAFFTQGRL